jgi:hypothetical protein
MHQPNTAASSNCFGVASFPRMISKLCSHATRFTHPRETQAYITCLPMNHSQSTIQLASRHVVISHLRSNARQATKWNGVFDGMGDHTRLIWSSASFGISWPSTQAKNSFNSLSYTSMKPTRSKPPENHQQNSSIPQPLD